MSAAIAACAASGLEVGWHGIDWAGCHRRVRRLQARIVKATQEGRWGKVKALQWLLTHSFSGKAIAVKRVTENKGKKTPGVDGETWPNPETVSVYPPPRRLTISRSCGGEHGRGRVPLAALGDHPGQVRPRQLLPFAAGFDHADQQGQCAASLLRARTLRDAPQDDPMAQGALGLVVGQRQIRMRQDDPDRLQSLRNSRAKARVFSCGESRCCSHSRRNSSSRSR